MQEQMTDKVRLAVFDLDDLFDRNLDLLDQVLQAVVLHRLFEVRIDLIFIA